MEWADELPRKMWGGWISQWSGVDTPNTFMTTRATAVLKKRIMHDLCIKISNLRVLSERKLPK